MLLNIPLTLLSHDPYASANMVNLVHLNRMYTDGLNQLAHVADGNIQESVSQFQSMVDSQLRWAGSERFLYKLVNELGIRIQKSDHEQFESLYRRDLLRGTERTPSWANVQNVFRRHQVELLALDDLDRMHTRWGMSTNSIIRHFRQEPGDVDSFLSAFRGISMLCDLDKLHLDRTLLRNFLQQYPLYEISASEFFNRNRYRRCIRVCDADWSVPYVQRTITVAGLSSFLENRRTQGGEA